MRLALQLSLALAAPAWAQVPAFPSTRAMGMGGALRGAATGDAAMSLNPSGISLLRSYVLEGSYTHASAAAEHDAHVSVVDSTSSYNIGGGVYYTYLSAAPEGGIERSGHEGGAALSLPFGDKVAIGALVKYLRMRSEGGPLLEPEVTRGFTFDIGMTIRPVSSVTLGLVAHNLRDMKEPRAPFALGGGITVSPIAALLIAFDGVLDFTSHDESRGNVVHLMGGAEYLVGKRFAFRAGGGRRGDLERGFVSGGVSMLAEMGAFDAGLQQDLSGERKETRFGIAARLFVPNVPGE